MTKTVLVSIFLLVISALVVCWSAGVLPPYAGSGAHGRSIPPGKAAPAATPAGAAEDGLSVYFSPGGGCTEAIVREITNARQSVYVQAHQFTSAPIGKALVAAHQRGLDVRVLLDRKKGDGNQAQISRLTEAAVPTFGDGRHHTAHNKVMIIDHHLVITGSFNLTWESESDNAENIVLIDGKPKIAAAYEANFKDHLGHSSPYAK